MPGVICPPKGRSSRRRRLEASSAITTGLFFTRRPSPSSAQIAVTLFSVLDTSRFPASILNVKPPSAA